MSNLNNYKLLAQALRDLFGSAKEPDKDIRSRQTSDAIQRILEIGSQLQQEPNAHPMLLHYLSRRSYQKALDFLESGSPESETTKCA